MKNIEVKYAHNNTTVQGFLIETVEDWIELANHNKISPVTVDGVMKLLDLGKRVFVNQNKGYCNIDSNNIIW